MASSRDVQEYTLTVVSTLVSPWGMLSRGIASALVIRYAKPHLNHVVFILTPLFKTTPSLNAALAPSQTFTTSIPCAACCGYG